MIDSRAWPMLANLYLHWFDKVFHRPDGPAEWAKAKLVRYADDFVVLARCQSPQLRTFIETKLEAWMGLEINREKTRVVDVTAKGASLDFLGYTFRYQRSLMGGSQRYLSLHPSKKSVARMRETVRQRTSRRQGCKPVPRIIGELNVQLTGWANYFRHGYPRMAFRVINTYVHERLRRHVRRRSQRPCRPPVGVTYHEHFTQLGLVIL